jgi:hypothetical protein
MFFFSTAQRKRFVAHERDIEELFIRKIITIETGVFHIKIESFVTIEAKVMCIIQD